MKENKKKYINSYNRKAYKMFSFRVKKDNVDVIDKLQSVPSMNQYINDLIEKDIHHDILTIKEIKERLLPVLSKHNIHEVYLFGSYARGEANSSSDVDIYCEPGDIKSLFDEANLIEELKEALKKDVDIVFTDSKLHEFFKEQLEGDKIKLR